MGVRKTQEGTSEVQLVPSRTWAFSVSVPVSPPGSDIIMQLDDVVSSTVTGPRVEEAMHRCVCVRGGDPGPAACSPTPFGLVTGDL